MTDFLVRRDDLRTWRTDDGNPPPAPGDGELQLRVERFGLTANNVTYGLFGDRMGYWQFFAAPDGWGRIPVWGFGEVLASGVDAIAAGERFYGYFPMSNGVTMRVEPDRAGFVDASPGRAALAASYNRYLRAGPASGFAPEHDDANAIMRPLFMTGWLIADQLEQAGWHDAGAVVLASASSKTAFAAAFEIAARDERPTVIGLTSGANRAFTEGLGCYDRVLTYDEISELPIEDRLAFVDMAGSPEVRRAVHEHAGDALSASIAVGATHWEGASLGADGPLPGPAPTLFFAPGYIETRVAELGSQVFLARVAAAWAAFADRVPELLEIASGHGFEDLGRTYDAFIEGRADPRKGYVFTLE